MSHFSVLVLQPLDITPDIYLLPSRADAENYVDTVLAPFSENLEVDEYERECYCVGNKAHGDAIKSFTENEPEWEDTVSELRQSFRSLTTEYKKLTHGECEFWGLEGAAEIVQEAGFVIPDELLARDRELQSAWDKHWEHQGVAIKVLNKAHVLYQRPDDSCDECDGSGRTRSTSNPQGHWDWCQVGGRWSGLLEEEYDPSHDAENQETCIHCTGTGVRYWAPKPVTATTTLSVFSADVVPSNASDPSAEASDCNACQGVGVAQKWPTEWIDRGNIAHASTVTDKMLSQLYAIVTPDGHWHARGDMGWFGCSSDVMDSDTWKAYKKSTLDKHLDCAAIVVDCHV